jgi:hypothetical protein
MLQVMNRTDAGRQASAESYPSPQTPHPRLVLSQTLSIAERREVEGDTQARSRGIKIPINHTREKIFTFTLTRPAERLKLSLMGKLKGDKQRLSMFRAPSEDYYG